MRQKAIVNARVIEGLNRPPLENGTVLVADAEITAVGPADAVSIPADAERIDASGHTVMPGLIDGHMHVTSMPGMLDARAHLEQNLRAVGKLRQCLAWGTTTVANVSGCPQNVVLRKAIDDGHVSGCARMMVGAMVNATGGHVRGRAADGPWEIRKAVREMVFAEVDFIKTAASGGFMWTHEDIRHEDYTLEELHVLAQEAHRRGKRVAVHAHSQPGLNHAIEAGCDVIAHGALIDDEALEGIAAKKLHFMPTLYITSEEVINRPGLAPHMKERMSQAHPVHRAGVRKAHQMGIALSVGTDGGPGSAMTELVELVRCGLSPIEAIVAATRNTADALDILDQTGTLEPGKKADLVVVAGNPLENIATMTDRKNILLVMKAGHTEVTTDEWRHYCHPRG